MAVKELKTADFDTTISNNDIVILDFWAPWCGPCKSFAPVFESVSKEHPDIVFAKINTDEETSLAGHFGIRSIPTLMVFRERVIVSGGLARSGDLWWGPLRETVRAEVVGLLGCRRAWSTHGSSPLSAVSPPLPGGSRPPRVSHGATARGQEQP